MRALIIRLFKRKKGIGCLSIAVILCIVIIVGWVIIDFWPAMWQKVTAQGILQKVYCFF